jgi:hypothetical protein
MKPKIKLLFFLSIIINVLTVSFLLSLLDKYNLPTTYLRKITRYQHFKDLYEYEAPSNNLPNVLIIGDSISIGYTLKVRKLLHGKANVYRIPEKGYDTKHALLRINSWIGNKKWDVIVFNWGLHDLSYKSITEIPPRLSIENGYRICSPMQYETNLRRLVQILKRTNAKLIWNHTTPIPNYAAGRIKGDEIVYNKIAKKIMINNEIAINDLHSYAQPVLRKIQLSNNVHFSQDGYEFLAEAIAKKIISLF